MPRKPKNTVTRKYALKNVPRREEPVIGDVVTEPVGEALVEAAPKKTGKMTKEEYKEQLRGKRLDGMNLRLKAPPARPGYTQRWINDIGDRIRRFEQAGWSFRDLSTVPEKVDSIDPGSRIARGVGTHGQGTASVTYLMEIPTEYYEAGQELKQEQIDRDEDQMRHGVVKGQAVGQSEYIVNTKIGGQS